MYKVGSPSSGSNACGDQGSGAKGKANQVDRRKIWDRLRRKTANSLEAWQSFRNSSTGQNFR